MSRVELDPSNCGGFTPCYGPSVVGPGRQPTWPLITRTTPDPGGWCGCTIRSPGYLPLYSFAQSFQENFPHGSFHVPSIAGLGFWQQGRRLGYEPVVGTTYFALSPVSGPAAGETFILVPFASGTRINTGFPGAFSTSPSPTAERYSVLGPGTESSYEYSLAFAKVTCSC